VVVPAPAVDTFVAVVEHAAVVDTYFEVVVPAAAVDTFAATAAPAAAEQVPRSVRKLVQTADVLFHCFPCLFHSLVHQQRFVDSSPLSIQMVQLNEHLKKNLKKNMYSHLGRQIHSGSESSSGYLMKDLMLSRKSRLDLGI